MDNKTFVRLKGIVDKAACDTRANSRLSPPDHIHFQISKIDPDPKQEIIIEGEVLENIMELMKKQLMWVGENSNYNNIRFLSCLVFDIKILNKLKLEDEMVKIVFEQLPESTLAEIVLGTYGSTLYSALMDRSIDGVLDLRKFIKDAIKGSIEGIGKKEMKVLTGFLKKNMGVTI